MRLLNGTAQVSKRSHVTDGTTVVFLYPFIISSRIIHDNPYSHIPNSSRHNSSVLVAHDTAFLDLFAPFSSINTNQNELFYDRFLGFHIISLSYPSVPAILHGQLSIARNAVCQSHGLDASIDGLLTTIALSGLIGLLLWVSCLIDVRSILLTGFSYFLLLFDPIFGKYTDWENGLHKKGTYIPSFWASLYSFML